MLQVFELLLYLNVRGQIRVNIGEADCINRACIDVVVGGSSGGSVNC